VEGILDQEVDKAALLLLNAIHQADPQGAFFPASPFTILPGRHGPGPALLQANGSALFICDFIDRVQECFPEVKLFHINRERGVTRYFEPLLNMVAWDRWRARKSADATRLIEELVALCWHLTERQMIAFGRHPTPRDSQEGLRFLHRTFRATFVGLLESFDSNQRALETDLSRAMAELHSIAKTGYVKVTEDGEHYRQAREHILGAEANCAREAVLACRRAWEDIGRNREWRTLAPKSRALYQFATALRAAARKNCWIADDGSAQSPEDELRLAAACWESEGAAAGAALPVDQLATGDLNSCRDRLEECIEAVMHSEFADP
jgi:hypothetical protein